MNRLRSAMYLDIAPHVRTAITKKRPIVALESTVISHGLPHPHNLDTARRVEQAIRKEGAVPATIGIINGAITVGLSDEQLERLATAPDVRKVSRRDFGIAIARQEDGATTAATCPPTCRSWDGRQWRWCAPGPNPSSTCRARSNISKRWACRCWAMALIPFRPSIRPAAACRLTRRWTRLKKWRPSCTRNGSRDSTAVC